MELLQDRLLKEGLGGLHNIIKDYSFEYEYKFFCSTSKNFMYKIVREDM